MLFPQACADKLKREMKDFGVPPRFPENSTKLDDAKKVCIVLCDLHCNDLRLMVFPAFDVYPSKLCTLAACKLVLVNVCSATAFMQHLDCLQ